MILQHFSAGGVAARRGAAGCGKDARLVDSLIEQERIGAFFVC